MLLFFVPPQLWALLSIFQYLARMVKQRGDIPICHLISSCFTKVWVGHVLWSWHYPGNLCLCCTFIISAQKNFNGSSTFGTMKTSGPRGAVGRAPDSLSQRSWVRYPVWQHTFVSSSADSRGTVVSYWRKYVHDVLVICLGGLSLPR